MHLAGSQLCRAGQSGGLAAIGSGGAAACPPPEQGPRDSQRTLTVAEAVTALITTVAVVTQAAECFVNQLTLPHSM